MDVASDNETTIIDEHSGTLRGVARYAVARENAA
jgi:hypothetical protein